ncbi:MAG: DUF1269 domain-containing protein, partial [Woeseiaceae bacterium]
WETLSMGGIIVGGAFLGSWTSSMVAINVQNTHLKGFMKDVNSGQILYMVDVPVQRIDEISDLVHDNHPEANMRGIDHTIPSFP